MSYTQRENTAGLDIDVIKIFQKLVDLNLNPMKSASSISRYGRKLAVNENDDHSETAAYMSLVIFRRKEFIAGLMHKKAY